MLCETTVKMIISALFKFDKFLLIATLLSQYACYEKTLRKMVRSQSKMVQRPISDNSGGNWEKMSRTMSQEFYPGHSQVNSVVHKMQRPKISTILSSIDNGRSRTLVSRMSITKTENVHPYELRAARGAATDVLQRSDHNLLFDDYSQHDLGNASNIDNGVDQTVNSLKTSNFFYSINTSTTKYTSDNDDIILIPSDIQPHAQSVNLTKIITSSTDSILNISKVAEERLLNLIKPALDVDKDKAECTTQAQMVTEKTYTCHVLKEAAADIETEKSFAGFDIEPQWMTEKQFWNIMYESRYEALMRNPKWPPLKVILIPRTNIHSIWRKSFESLHNETVRSIISNIVKKLNFYSNLTFSWNEVSHLAYWWKNARQKSRATLHRLVNEGRLEITTGGWVETAESTSHLFGIIHQLIEGHQWLQHNLNCTPDIGWLTASVTHSSTFTYLLSSAGISHLVFTNLHFSWQQFLTEYQYTDFVWVQNWDSNKNSETILNKALHKIGNERYPRHSVLAHYLQFNSGGFQACGPKSYICSTEFNFANIKNNIHINTFNVKEKSEKLLEQYSKTGTTSSHNVIIAPIGDQFSYEYQTEFDYQYNNYQKISEFVNVNQAIYKATVNFGTAKDYFKSVLTNHKVFPTVMGDFHSFADIGSGKPTYWIGQFIASPTLKILVRRIQATLRSTEILFSIAHNFNVFKEYNTSSLLKRLTNAREIVARLQDRDVVSGTLTAKATRYVQDEILKTAKDCWYIQEISASLLTTKPGLNESYLEKYIYRDGEMISSFKPVTSGDQIYIFNSLNHERTEAVELLSGQTNLRILDYNKKEIEMQINPIWKYTPENEIKISRQYFKIYFLVVIPPMSFQLFKIKKSYNIMQSVSALYCVQCVTDDSEDGSELPFSIHALEKGDIQLENYRLRLTFDEYTGLLKTVTEKTTNNDRKFLIDFGAFKSSRINSAIFLCNATSRPLVDVFSKYKINPTSMTTMIVSGKLTTELVSISSKFLRHSVKIFHLIDNPLSNAIKLETKVDLESYPKSRNLEDIFMSITTDINNGNSPKIFTDNNGFQYSHRSVNLSRRFESNVFPMTSMAFIEDDKNRLTVVTDHAQGVTSLQEGQLVILLGRRVARDDGRGHGKGIAESSITHQTHYILLETFKEPKTQETNSKTNLRLPTLSAIYLANTLNYQLDVYYIVRSNNCHYAFFPLVKTKMPCDVTVLNYRVLLNNISKFSSKTALMTLHRQSYSCSIDPDANLHCGGEEIILNKVFHNIKAAYLTNLVGTSKGVEVHVLNKDNFAPMEIITLRVHF